jgi:hypothetical protein
MPNLTPKKIHRVKGDGTACEKRGKFINVGADVYLVSEEGQQLRTTAIDGRTTCRLCIRSMLGLRKLTPNPKQKFVYRRPAPHIRRADTKLGLLKP